MNGSLSLRTLNITNLTPHKKGTQTIIRRETNIYGYEVPKKSQTSN